MSDPRNPAILVASCGNIMAGDDAFGPQVTGLLRRRPLPPAVRVIDLDIRPTALLEYLAGQESLILVDAAVSARHRPGTLLCVDWFAGDRPQLVHDDALSTHGLSLGHQLELAAALQTLPEKVTLVALIAEPADIGDAACYVRPESREAAVACIQKLIGNDHA